MVNKCFVVHEEVIDVFHENFYIPTIENCHFILIVSEFLVQWNVERLEIIVFTGTWIQMLTPFVDINYFRLLEVRKFILNSKVLFLLPCSLIHCFPPQDLWGPPFVIYRVFVASFDLVDAI